MNLSFVGTGYVGLVSALGFAHSSHRVFACDKDPAKVDKLKKGIPPFYEPGLIDLLKKCDESISYHTSVKEVVHSSPIIFVAVGTPASTNGQVDMSELNGLIEEILVYVDRPKIIVLKSTVKVGYTKQLQKYCDSKSPHPIKIVNNPEFLRQGSAVQDFLYPDRVVIGHNHKESFEIIKKLYTPFVANENLIIEMDSTSAEITKYAANSFLAMKISFINEMALFTEKMGGDIQKVKQGMIRDHRINQNYLNPGVGYGGSCLPKDTRALLEMGKEVGLEMHMAQACDSINERQSQWIFNSLDKNLPQYSPRVVCIWGLSFKPETDDIRSAPSIKIIGELINRGCKVKAYDPVASDKAKEYFGEDIEIYSSAEESAKNSHAILVLTEWKNFTTIKPSYIQGTVSNPLILDGRGQLPMDDWEQSGFKIVRMGQDPSLNNSDTPQLNIFNYRELNSLQ